MGILNGYNPKNGSVRRPEENYRETRGSIQRKTEGSGVGTKYEKVLFEYREALAEYQDCLVEIQINKGGNQSEYVGKYEKMLLEYREALNHFKECIFQCQTTKNEDQLVNTDEYEKTLLEYRQALAGYKDCLIETNQKKSTEVVVNTNQMEATLAQYSEVLAGYKSELQKLQSDQNSRGQFEEGKSNLHSQEIEKSLKEIMDSLQGYQYNQPLTATIAQYSEVLSGYKSELEKLQSDQNFGGQFEEGNVNLHSEEIEKSLKEIKDSLQGNPYNQPIRATDNMASTEGVDKTLSEYKDALAYYKDCLHQYEEKIDLYDDKLNEYSKNSSEQIEEVQKVLDLTYIKEQTNKISEQLDAMVQTKDDIKKSEQEPEALGDIKKKLEDMIRFVAKLDGSIVEAVKTNSYKNKEELVSQITELMQSTKKSKKGIKLSKVFSVLLNLATAGGVAVLILIEMGILVI